VEGSDFMMRKAMYLHRPFLKEKCPTYGKTGKPLKSRAYLPFHTWSKKADDVEYYQWF